MTGQETIDRLVSEGIRLFLLGDQVLGYRYEGEGEPDKDKVIPLLDALKRNKTEVMELLEVGLLDSMMDFPQPLAKSEEPVQSNSTKKAIKTTLDQNPAKDTTPPEPFLDSEGDLIIPGQCETCRAGAEWDYLGPGLWCFYDAVFKGRAGSKENCETARLNCPLGIVTNETI